MKNRLHRPGLNRYAEFASGKTASDLSTEIATRSKTAPWLDIYEALPNPDPVLRNTSNYIGILDEIKRECHVKACTKSRKAGVQRRKWKIEGYDASPLAIETITKIFDDLDTREIIREALDGWGYGFKPLEILWQREGDLTVPFQVSGKPPQWFAFDKNNELRLRLDGFKLQPVKPYKFLLARYEASYNNPYGEAEFSLCFWPTTFKKGGIKFWAMFLERFGMPHAIGKTRPGADVKERDDLLTALTGLIRDAAGIIPNDASVELLETNGGSGTSDLYWRHAHYHDGEISKVLLGHASAADSTPGRLGSDTSAMDVRSDIIDDDSVMVEKCMDNLIRWIHELNPQLGDARPRFEIYDENDVDTARADRDFKLMNSGRVILKKSYFTKRYDFSDDDIDVVETPDLQAPTPATSPVRPAQFSAPPKSADAAQTEVDSMLAGISDADLQKQSDELLKPLIALVESATSFDDLSKKLPALYPGLDDAAIAAMLKKAMLLANVKGASA